MIDQLGTKKMHEVIKLAGIKEIVGVHGTFIENTWMLVGITVGCSVGSLVTLYVKRKPI
jgi:hypothetical protein